MAWWLEDATSRHFGWVRNPPKAFFFFFLRFLESKNKRKNREISEKVGKFRGNIGKNLEKSEKRNFGGDILSISTDNRYFDRNIGNFVPCSQLGWNFPVVGSAVFSKTFLKTRSPGWNARGFTCLL